MDYYIDVILNADADMRENVLLNKAYTRLHKAFCDLKSKEMGVSFPDYKIKLGKTLRIHGTQDQLRILQKLNWLGNIGSYCCMSEAQPVPQNVKYRTVSRYQSNMTAAKLRRLNRRKDLSDQEMKDYKAKMFSKGLSLPYLELESTSTGKKYRHFICLGELLENAIMGDFNQFGLSKSATIPWF